MNRVPTPEDIAALNARYDASCKAISEGIDRLQKNNAMLIEAADHMLVAHESESETHYAAAIAKLRAALSAARGDHE